MSRHPRAVTCRHPWAVMSRHPLAMVIWHPRGCSGPSGGSSSSSGGGGRSSGSPSVAGDWYSSPSVAGDLGFPFLASGHVGFPPPTWAMETAKLGTPDVAVSLAVALLPSALDSPAVALLFWEGAVEWEMPFNPLPADGAPTSDLYSAEESTPAALPFFLLQLVLAAPGDSRVSPSFSPGPAVVPLPGVGDGSPRQWQSTTPL
ncbi:UNVERIFIED_CONTAM: hypothetical protein FKN15_029865 [Acipenser sinensis]